MKRSLVSDAEIFQNAPVRLQNRLVKSNQSLLLLSDVTSWTMKVISGTTVHTVINAQAPGSNFFSALQTGNGWSRDSTGYTFEYVFTPTGVISGASAEAYEGGKTYRLEFSAVDAGGATLAKWVWNVKVLPWAG
jgi:hypothetical protein